MPVQCVILYENDEDLAYWIRDEVLSSDMKGTCSRVLCHPVQADRINTRAMYDTAVGCVRSMLLDGAAVGSSESSERNAGKSSSDSSSVDAHSTHAMTFLILSVFWDGQSESSKESFRLLRAITACTSMTPQPSSRTAVAAAATSDSPVSDSSLTLLSHSVHIILQALDARKGLHRIRDSRAALVMCLHRKLQKLLCDTRMTHAKTTTALHLTNTTSSAPAPKANTVYNSADSTASLGDCMNTTISNSSSNHENINPNTDEALSAASTDLRTIHHRSLACTAPKMTAEEATPFDSRISSTNCNCHTSADFASATLTRPATHRDTANCTEGTNKHCGIEDISVVALQQRVEEGQGECFVLLCGATHAALARRVEELQRNCTTAKLGVMPTLLEPRPLHSRGTRNAKMTSQQTNSNTASCQSDSKDSKTTIIAKNTTNTDAIAHSTDTTSTTEAAADAIDGASTTTSDAACIPTSADDTAAKAAATVLGTAEDRSGTSTLAQEFLLRCDGALANTELRLVMCGNVDSGKSTLTAVLTRGCHDNGRGFARTFVFNHKHEMETGRTSSISESHLGFTANGDVTNYIIGSVDRRATAAAFGRKAANAASSSCAATMNCMGDAGIVQPTNDSGDSRNNSTTDLCNVCGTATVPAQQGSANVISSDAKTLDNNDSRNNTISLNYNMHNGASSSENNKNNTVIIPSNHTNLTFSCCSGGSSITHTFTDTPAVRNFTRHELSEHSAKLLTLYDLAGHERYLRTTVLGLTRNMPDYGCVVISGNNGIQRMTREHIELCLALKIPFFVVITRIDATPANVLAETRASVSRMLKLPSVRKLPYPVRQREEVVIAAKNLRHDRIAPVFEVSNVAGAGLDLVLRFLNFLPTRTDWRAARARPKQLVIDSTFFVPGVGTVVGGVVRQGVFRVNDTVLLGPDGQGHFRPVCIKSIHMKGTDQSFAEAGNDAGFCLKKERRSAIRKGNVLLDAHQPATAYWQFEMEVTILYHSTTIVVNYEPVIHASTVRQSARITYVEKDVLRTGDRSTARFHFLYRPEYMMTGQRIVFREGRTKGVGVVTKIIQAADESLLNSSKLRKKRALATLLNGRWHTEHRERE